MDNEDLVTVYTASNAVQAEIVKNALAAEGFETFVEDELQAGEAGVAGVPVFVQVPSDQAERARRFIEEHERRRAEEEE